MAIGTQNQGDSFISDDEEELCPLCVEEMDLSDKNFKPCPCGYQVCQFCYNNIRTNPQLNGKCPACRRPYDDASVEYRQVSPEEFKRDHMRQSRKEKERKEKERQKKESDQTSKKHLAGMRVIQKNLVYVIGLNPNIPTDELHNTLRGDQFFGQYGKIQKIVINRRNNANGNPGLGVYVTFARKEDAARCIAAVDNSMNDGKQLRAAYGTTKYCSSYLRGQTCPNPNCMFLHEPGEEADSYSRQDLSTIQHAARVNRSQMNKRGDANQVSYQQHQQQLQHQQHQHQQQPYQQQQQQQQQLHASSSREHMEPETHGLPPTVSWAQKASPPTVNQPLAKPKAADKPAAQSAPALETLLDPSIKIINEGLENLSKSSFGFVFSSRVLTERDLKSQNLLPAFFSLAKDKAQAADNLSSLLAALQPGAAQEQDGILGLPAVSVMPQLGEGTDGNPPPGVVPPFPAAGEEAKQVTATPPPGLFSNQGVAQHHQNQNSHELLAHLMNGGQRATDEEIMAHVTVYLEDLVNSSEFDQADDALISSANRISKDSDSGPSLLQPPAPTMPPGIPVMTGPNILPGLAQLPGGIPPPGLAQGPVENPSRVPPPGLAPPPGVPAAGMPPGLGGSAPPPPGLSGATAGESTSQPVPHVPAASTVHETGPSSQTFKSAPELLSIIKGQKKPVSANAAEADKLADTAQQPSPIDKAETEALLSTESEETKPEADSTAPARIKRFTAEPSPPPPGQKLTRRQKKKLEQAARLQQSLEARATIDHTAFKLKSDRHNDESAAESRTPSPERSIPGAAVPSTKDDEHTQLTPKKARASPTAAPDTGAMKTLTNLPTKNVAETEKTTAAGSIPTSAKPVPAKDTQSPPTRIATESVPQPADKVARATPVDLVSNEASAEEPVHAGVTKPQAPALREDAVPVPPAAASATDTAHTPATKSGESDEVTVAKNEPAPKKQSGTSKETLTSVPAAAGSESKPHKKSNSTTTPQLASKAASTKVPVEEKAALIAPEPSAADEKKTLEQLGDELYNEPTVSPIADHADDHTTDKKADDADNADQSGVKSMHAKENDALTGKSNEEHQSKTEIETATAESKNIELPREPSPLLPPGSPSVTDESIAASGDKRDDSRDDNMTTGSLEPNSVTEEQPSGTPTSSSKKKNKKKKKKKKASQRVALVVAAEDAENIRLDQYPETMVAKDFISQSDTFPKTYARNLDDDDHNDEWYKSYDVLDALQELSEEMDLKNHCFFRPEPLHRHPPPGITEPWKGNVSKFTQYEIDRIAELRSEELEKRPLRVWDDDWGEVGYDAGETDLSVDGADPPVKRQSLEEALKRWVPLQDDSLAKSMYESEHLDIVFDDFMDDLENRSEEFYLSVSPEDAQAWAYKTSKESQALEDSVRKLADLNKMVLEQLAF